jgi:hypothetical protein
MGNDKYISWEGTPREVHEWTEDAIADVAHATGVALTVRPKGIFGFVGEPPWVLGIAYTSSMRGGDLVSWLHEHLRSGRVWFHDLDWPENRAWFNNNDGRGWEPVK